MRAALWTGDYGRALAWIERMPASLATQPRWRYWRARAMAATAGADAAAPLYEEIAGLRDYYGYLAADRLHRSYSLNARPSPDDAKVQGELAAELGLIRAHELFACDMADEAAAEWTAVLGERRACGEGSGGASCRALGLVRGVHCHPGAGRRMGRRSAALPAPLSGRRRRGQPARGSARRLDTGRHAPGEPVSQGRRVARGCARPHADAAGHRRRGRAPLAPAGAPQGQTCSMPSVAVPLGAAYLRELLDRFAGQLDLALAAYNAGPTSVARWLPAKATDADVWIENIPYSETRGYVQHILEHIVAFAYVQRRRTAAPRSTDAGRRAGDAGEPAKASAR